MQKTLSILTLLTAALSAGLFADALTNAPAITPVALQAIPGLATPGIAPISAPTVQPIPLPNQTPLALKTPIVNPNAEVTPGAGLLQPVKLMAAPSIVPVKARPITISAQSATPTASAAVEVKPMPTAAAVPAP